MYKIGEVVIPIGRPFTHPTTLVKYPANWITLSTQSDRDLIGMTWEDDPIPPAPEPPSFEEQKATKIAQIDAKTKQIFALGVPAEVNGEEYLFDTRTGERAAVNWQILDSVITRALMVPALEAQLFPRNISTINDEHVLSLGTASDANNFWIALMTADNAIATAGATLRKAAHDAQTQEELDAVVDPR